MGVAFGHEPESGGGFDGRGGFVAFCTSTSEPLPSVISVACCGLGELEIRAEQRATKLVTERRVAAWQLANERVAADERAASDVKCVESVMSEPP